MLVCLGASVQRYSLTYLFIFQFVAAKIQVLEDNVFLPKTQSTLAMSGSSLKINNKTTTKKSRVLRLISGWLVGWEDWDRLGEGTQPFVSSQVCREELSPDGSSIGGQKTTEPGGIQPKTTTILHSSCPLAIQPHMFISLSKFTSFFLFCFVLVFLVQTSGLWFLEV